MATVLAISLLTITLYVSSRGIEHLPIRVPRFALTVALCLWLYRGSNFARVICILLFGEAGIMGVEGAMQSDGNVMALVMLGGMAISYLSCAIVLIASPAVSAFLEYQRETLPQKSTFVHHKVGAVFLWKKHTRLKPIDRLTLVLPAGMRDALNCESGTEISTSENEGRIHVRLGVGAEAWISRPSQVFLLPWSDGEGAPKLIQLTPMPKADSAGRPSEAPPRRET